MLHEQLQHIISSSLGILPELILFLGSLVLLLTDLILHKKQHIQPYLLLSGIVLLLSFYAWQQQGALQHVGYLYQKMLLFDAKSHLVKGIVLLIGVFVLVHHHIFRLRFEAEWYATFLVLLAGLSLLAMSINLMSIYVCIEVSSIAAYILVSWGKQAKNVEAGIKYLLFGAASSAIMLYGISLLYGMTGTMDLSSPAFAQHLSAQNNWVVWIALLLCFGGLLFKISVVPFHTWVPDVYEASPVSLLAFLSTAPKIAALLVLFHLSQYLHHEGKNILVVLIIASLTIGNLSALWQTNFKRMLGYSSIAHAGFLLTGLLAFPDLGWQAMLFYAITYILMNWGAFIAAEVLEQTTGQGNIVGFAGLGRQQVVFGISVLILMIGLVGLPPTVGFTGKWLVFSALWQTYTSINQLSLLLLLVFALLNAAISLAYYLKIPYYLFFKEPTKPRLDIPRNWLYWLVFFVSLTIGLFFIPELLLP